VAGIDERGRLILRVEGIDRPVDYGELNAPEAQYANT
jgi:hypothetical protein